MSLLKSLFNAYYAVSYGNEEPDTLRVSIPLHLKMVEQDWYLNFQHPDGRITQFMNASVKPDPKLEDDEFVFENSHHLEGTPYAERFNIRATVEW